MTSLLPNVVDYTMAAARNLENHIGVTRANLLGVGLPYATAWVRPDGQGLGTAQLSRLVCRRQVVLVRLAA